MRITLAAWIVRLRWFAKVLGVVVLLAISVGSAEGLVLAFEQAVQSRVRGVMDAEQKVARAQEAVDAEDKREGALQADRDKARDDVARLDASIATEILAAPQMPTPSGKTCAGTKGRATTCRVDDLAQKTYRDAMAAHQKALTDLRAERKAAQARVDALDPATTGTHEKAFSDLREARRTYAVEASFSPMHRIAASVAGVEVGEVTSAHFETVKRYSVFGLAIAFATMSALVSFVAYSEPSDGSERKLLRTLRAWIARRRKEIIAIRQIEVPGPEREVEKVVEVEKKVFVDREIEKRVEVPVEKIVLRYVPVDVRNGRFVKGEEREIVSEDEHAIVRGLRTVPGGR